MAALRLALAWVSQKSIPAVLAAAAVVVVGIEAPPAGIEAPAAAPEVAGKQPRWSAAAFEDYLSARVARRSRSRC